jgi:cytoskeletal protein CcmA (bactofilin family)
VRAVVGCAPAHAAQKPAHFSRMLAVTARNSTGNRGTSVAEYQGVLLVREDTIIRGEIRNCRQMEVYGYVEGNVATGSLLIHPNGQCYGTVKTESAEVRGTLQGDVVVKHLIQIRDTGSVSGNVQYGALAMEVGGNLSAEVRNVPPKVAGDLDVTVIRGLSVLITLEDLHAIDPDDEPKDLVFSVSNPRNGFVSMLSAPGRPAAKFTQADLEAGKVSFTHDGAAAPTASFDVIVTDHTGATSGRPQTVKVTVRGA